MTAEQQCAHEYQYCGVVYSQGDRCPGSGAHYRVYEDKFFCSRCLDTQYRNRRTNGHSTYDKVLVGSMPK